MVGVAWTCAGALARTSCDVLDGLIGSRAIWIRCYGTIGTTYVAVAYRVWQHSARRCAWQRIPCGICVANICAGVELSALEPHNGSST